MVSTSYFQLLFAKCSLLLSPYLSQAINLTEGEGVQLLFSTLIQYHTLTIQQLRVTSKFAYYPNSFTSFCREPFYRLSSCLPHQTPWLQSSCDDQPNLK